MLDKAAAGGRSVGSYQASSPQGLPYGRIKIIVVLLLTDLAITLLSRCEDRPADAVAADLSPRIAACVPGTPEGGS
jgi:hypothetical protein